MKKKKNKKYEIKQWLKRYRVIVSILFVTIGMSFVIISVILSDGVMWQVDVSKIEKIKDIFQIISVFFVISGTLIAVLQYYLASQSKMSQIHTDKVQKSIDLAKYYKDEILGPFPILENVYRDCNVIEILSRKTAEFKDFDYEEMTQIFSQSELNKMNDLCISQEFIKAIVHISEIWSLNLSGYECDVNLESNGDIEYGVKKIRIDAEKLVNDFMSKYVMDIMNNMEHFAMYFTHNIADESVVYESLSPTYLEMCRVLYCDISRCSQPGTPQLYRNLTMLYNIWADKEDNDKKKRRDSKKQNRNHGTVAGTL